jgi:hypothetical protein
MSDEQHEQQVPPAQPAGSGPAARTPQQDHTPRQEEQYARDRQERLNAARAQRAEQRSPEAQHERDAAMAASSIGAQIILDYNEDGSLGARGGFGKTVEENTLARDAHLVAVGLDPVSPSGPPPSPEQLAAKRKREAEEADPQFMPPPSGKATRMSSLAAGINTGDVPEPPPTEPEAV